jgi:DNA polymerase phi
LQAKEIISVVQRDPTLGFAFILQLTGVHGNQQFDKLTKTKTIESILTKMNAIDIENYISHMLEQVDGGSASEQYDIRLFQEWSVTHRAPGLIPSSSTRVARGLLNSSLLSFVTAQYLRVMIGYK